MADAPRGYEPLSPEIRRVHSQARGHRMNPDPALSHQIVTHEPVNGSSRHGQRCAVLSGDFMRKTVRFEDGSTAVVPFAYVRRAKR